MADAFEALLAGKPAGGAESTASVSAFDALLSGDASPAPAVSAPLLASPGRAEIPGTGPQPPRAKPAQPIGIGEQLLGGTADALDFIFAGIPSMALAAAGDVTTRVQQTANSALGLSEPKSRREVSAAGNETAARINTRYATPARSVLQSLGLLSERPLAIGQAMEKVSHVIDSIGSQVEAKTGGAVLKEDVLTGVNMLFGAAAGKGVKLAADAPAKMAKARDAMKAVQEMQAAGELKAFNEAGAPSTPDPAAAPYRQRNPAAADPNVAAFDARARAEQKAYELMRDGAPQRRVDAMIKADPAIGAAMDRIAERRATASAFAEDAPAMPVEGPPTIETVTSLLRRPSEMTAAEVAARDAAGGVQRGPMGEPILSANPSAPPQSRSVRDPARRAVVDSGLMGAPVKRDAMGTPLSGPTLTAVVGATGLGLAAYFAAKGDTDDAAMAAASGAFILGKGKGLPLEAIRNAADTTTLAALRDADRVTLNTLENLPGNRASFSKQSVAELLKRAEITKAERDVIQPVLDAAPSDTITAKALMLGIKERTGNFELKAKESSEFADYGLEVIDRASADYFDNPTPASAALGSRGIWEVFDRNGDVITEARNATDEASAMAEVQAVIDASRSAQDSATTTIWQSPVELGSNNHFRDPNYFAHSRSFVENGVRHVVELQSDLAQRAGKVLTPEERAALVEQKVDADRLSLLAEEAYAATSDVRSTTEDVVSAAKRYFAGLEDIAIDRKLIMGQHLWDNYELGSLRNKIEAADPGGRSGHMGNYDVVVDTLLKEVESAGPDMSKASSALESAFYNEKRTHELRRRELEIKLKEAPGLEAVSPMLKRWDKRIIREELARAAREGEGNVRFATADTVAKVEGWPDNQATAAERLKEYSDKLQLHINNVDNLEAIKRGEPPKDPYYIEYKASDPEWYQDVVRGIDATLAKARSELAVAQANFERAKENSAGPRFRPEHQGIYDRYAGDVTKFLKQLGGREITDSAGHTWIEVPTEGTKRQPAGPRAQQFGSSDPQLLAAVAAIGGGAALGAYLDEERKLRGAALGGLGATILSLGLFARSHSPGISEMAQAAGRGAEYTMGLVSTRVGEMSQALLRRMREHERGVLTRTNGYLREISPFVEHLRKLPRDVQERLSMAMLSGDSAKVVATLGSARAVGLIPEWKKARTLLDTVGRELMDAGKLKGVLPDYYPRIVIDAPGLIKALGGEERTFIEQRLADAQAKAQKTAGRDLSPLEVSAVINQALKSRPGDGKPGFLKRRSVEEIDARLLPFYAPASESLPLYLRAVGKELERARFFGDNLVRDPVTGLANLDQSIGNLVREEWQAKRITADQMSELADILRSRFGPGERATSRGLQAAKNMAYAGLLGNVTSALTQTGDLLVAAYAHGTLPALKALQQQVTNRAARATVHDLGLIDHMSEEITGATRTPVTVAGRQISTAKFLDGVFRWSGFSAVDQLGKNVSIQASRIKLEGWAKSPTGMAKLKAKYGDAYPAGDFDALVADLRSGVLTDRVKGVLFSELSDLQPISKLEVPQAYLDMPNGRVIYMLKTFMLKQMDVARRDVVREFKTGSKAKAVENGLRLGLALGIAGTGTQMFNDWLLGRMPDTDLGDIPLNALKTYGWSKYTIDKVREGKPAEAAAGVVLPPYKMIDTIISANPAAIQYLPVAGKFIYAHNWGDLLEESGAEKYNRKLEQRRNREGD